MLEPGASLVAFRSLGLRFARKCLCRNFHTVLLVVCAMLQFTTIWINEDSAETEFISRQVLM